VRLSKTVVRRNAAAI